MRRLEEVHGRVGTQWWREGGGNNGKASKRPITRRNKKKCNIDHNRYSKTEDIHELCSPVRSSVRSSVYLFVNFFVRRSSFVRSFVHLLVLLFIRSSFFHLLVHTSICSFNSYTRVFVQWLICRKFDSAIHLFSSLPHSVV